MSNRHLSRTLVLQTLFEWDFNGKKDDVVSGMFVYNVKEFSQTICDLDFAEKLLNLVIGKIAVLDDIVQKAAPQWPIEKISIIDRNILRIGLGELLFADKKEVPPKVAINEAIELAKMFGGDNSSKFISGVLGTIYKELGEPDKDDVSKKKRIPDIPFEKMLVEKKCGAVIYCLQNNEIMVALVHDVFGHWTLSKGTLEKNETEENCVIRETKEEIGLDVVVEEKLGDNEYIAYDPEKGKTRRQVSYYLAKSNFDKVEILEKDGGLNDARWFNLSEIINLNFYDDVLPIVIKATEILKKKK